jgi:hypothetical protein
VRDGVTRAGRDPDGFMSVPELIAFRVTRCEIASAREYQGDERRTCGLPNGAE